MLGVAFALPRLTASSEPVDERSFERFTRTLGAVSDAVIIGTLFLAMIFRPTLSAFGLLAFMFMAREVLLVLARRARKPTTVNTVQYANFHLEKYVC
jgi:hypothetical protein